MAASLIQNRIELLVHGFIKEIHSEIPTDIKQLTTLWLTENEESDHETSALLRVNHMITQQDAEAVNSYHSEQYKSQGIPKAHAFDIWLIEPSPYKWIAPITKYKLNCILIEQHELELFHDRAQQ